MGQASMLSKKLSICLVLALISTLAMVPITFSQSLFLAVTVTSEKSTYHYRQLVNIYGNVTFEDSLVEEGLVALQLQNPYSTTLAVRTVPANMTPSQSWTVEITSFLSTDSNGDPKNTFKKKTFAYFKTSIKNNNMLGSQTVLLAITLCDIDSTPFQIHWLKMSINPGANHTELVGLYIDEWVSTGTATAYANVHTDFPSNGGYPYSPEKSATFTITSTSGSASASTSPTLQPRQNSYNSYEATIRLPPQAPLGNYTITASAYYKGFKDAFDTATFNREYEMLGDIIFDRSIDIYDVVVVVSAYGSRGGNPKWNPEADLEANGEIDIYDVVIVTGKYGTTY